MLSGFETFRGARYLDRKSPDGRDQYLIPIPFLVEQAHPLRRRSQLRQDSLAVVSFGVSGPVDTRSPLVILGNGLDSAAVGYQFEDGLRWVFQYTRSGSSSLTLPHSFSAVLRNFPRWDIPTFLSTGHLPDLAVRLFNVYLTPKHRGRDLVRVVASRGTEAKSDKMRVEFILSGQNPIPLLDVSRGHQRWTAKDYQDLLSQGQSKVKGAALANL